MSLRGESKSPARQVWAEPGCHRGAHIEGQVPEDEAPLLEVRALARHLARPQQRALGQRLGSSGLPRLLPLDTVDERTLILQ